MLRCVCFGTRRRDTGFSAPTLGDAIEPDESGCLAQDDEVVQVVDDALSHLEDVEIRAPFLLHVGGVW